MTSEPIEPPREREPATAEGSVPRAKDGTLMVPSVQKRPDGKPRFHLPVPPGLLGDVAIKHLVEREAGFGGFEVPTRAFFEAHLAPGDLFIDVGAHWGIMTLSAATAPCGDIRALALEPHPLNVVQLMRSVVANGLHAQVEVVAAAAGDRPGTAPLVANSTMGHSLRGVGLKGIAARGYPVSVPIVALDDLLAERPELSERPVVMKIDVEGFEPQVIEGAARLLASGRVKALAWEKGRAFDEEPGLSQMKAMIESLGGHGFRQFLLPSHDLGGPPLPFVPARGSCNVFALAAGEEPLPAYIRPPGRIPPIAPSNRGSREPEERARLTEALMAIGGSDGVRWADPQELGEGADARAALAARHIAPGESVLDLGAGAMRAKRLLPQGCAYRPVDLVPFTAGTLVRDLQKPGPALGEADVALLLEVLEFIHDPARLLAEVRQAAPRLLLTYRLAAGGETEGRRAAGFFNDLTEADLMALLEATGWRLEKTAEGAGARLFVCEGKS